MDFPTLAERKSSEAVRRRAAAATVVRALADYARRTGGRYGIFGSSVEDRMRYDSDIDILVDFPQDRRSDAWTFAEDLCAANDLPADILPLAWCSDRFLAHVKDRVRWVP